MTALNRPSYAFLTSRCCRAQVVPAGSMSRSPGYNSHSRHSMSANVLASVAARTGEPASVLSGTPIAAQTSGTGRLGWGKAVASRPLLFAREHGHSGAAVLIVADARLDTPIEVNAFDVRQEAVHEMRA